MTASFVLHEYAKDVNAADMMTTSMTTNRTIPKLNYEKLTTNNNHTTVVVPVKAIFIDVSGHS